ncbi:MAG: FMN-binding protein [Clostridiales bacterium]|nr:FMN-binding protein [Clostridiales bacterium]
MRGGRRVFLWLAVALLLSGCAKRKLLKNGIYTTSELGYTREPVYVTLVIEDHRLAQVIVNSNGESPNVGAVAGPVLSKRLQESGHTKEIDIVSGATVTSKAAFDAFDRAYKKALE